MIYIAMISRTDEPMEGVVFDVQDHTRRTGTRGLGTHGEMISSDLHGAEEPIRWLLGSHQWQRQDSDMMSLCTREEEGCSTQDTLAEPSLRVMTHFRWNVFLLMDRTSPRRLGRHLERGSLIGLLARVAAWRSPKRANV